MRRHLSDYEQFLQLKAVEGYPKQGVDGSNQHKCMVVEHKSKQTENVSLQDIAKRLNWSETKIKQAQWLDNNAPWQ